MAPIPGLARALLLCVIGMGTACSASGADSAPPESAGGVGNGASGSPSGDGGFGFASGGDGTVPILGSGGVTGAGGGAPGGGVGAGGAGACTGTAQEPPDKQANETCDNGLDDDLNGFVDENCACNTAGTQECFLGTASQARQPNCHKGTQTCGGTAEFRAWGPCEGSGCGQVIPPEVCNNGKDDNCNGRIDEGCSFDMTVAIDGDCLGIPCPPQAPNPIGCQITMQGNDSRGCVAHAAANNAVYFQEGDACPVPGCQLIGACGDSGHISGTLKCSAAPDAVTIDATNCPINKPQPIYTDNPGGCP